LKWIELSIKVREPEVEAVTSILAGYGHGGTVTEEWQEANEHTKAFQIKAFLPHSRAYQEQKRKIDQQLEQLNEHLSLSLQERLLKPEDWLDSLKKHFRLLEVGEKFVIRPSWEPAQPSESGRIIIELDPGAAFGTGLHPTTRLCLQHLEKSIGSGMSVFDLGTGSGILAIAAVKLGAAPVLAVDIDPVAVRVAKANAAANGVFDSIRFARGSLSLRRQRANLNTFDLVLANITSRAICDLAGPMFKVLKPSGKLIASGIHQQGLDETLISLVMVGFHLEKAERAEEWYAIIAQKPFLSPSRT
jgi:ribosomal protein L11 methyltransferase